MNHQSKLNDDDFLDEEFDSQHYINSLKALVDMHMDRLELYPHDKYVQMAGSAFIRDLLTEMYEVRQSQMVMIPVYFAAENLNDLEGRTEIRLDRIDKKTKGNWAQA